ncbi:MAG: transglycosylase SLT domain-containing protein [Candidatus Bruticola sp.]
MAPNIVKCSKSLHTFILMLLFIWQPIPSSAQDIILQEPYKSQAYLNSYYHTIRYYNSTLSDKDTKKIVLAILHYAYEYSLDPRLVTAVLACESNFNPKAVSPAGAIGLGQLMPETAKSVKTDDPYNINLNIRGSCYILKGHLLRYGCSSTEDLTYLPKALSLTLAAYNAGPGAVSKYQGIPPYRETQNYVRNVLREYRRLCGYE